jgi:hypothetical protein
MIAFISRPCFRFLALAGFCLAHLPAARGATLNGAFLPIPQGTEVNLTAEGPLDWVHWGLVTESSVNRKAGVAPQIPDFVPLGFAGPYRDDDNFNGYSWIDGAPATAITNTPTGVWVYGQTNGFQLEVPAETATRTLKVYVGTYAAVGKFEATLSGAPGYSDASITNVGNGPGGVYTLDYAADLPGDMLVIKYTVGEIFQSAGNVTLQAAALSARDANNPPAVAITSPTSDTSFAALAALTISAEAVDIDGTVSRVEFFNGTTKLGESSTPPFQFTWNDVAHGQYVLTATATDNDGGTRISAPVEIFVHGNGGTLTGTVAFPAPTVNLTAEGTADWAHWGLTSTSYNHKDGVIPQISDFTQIGTNEAQQFKDNFITYAWTDGKPRRSASDTPNAVYIHGLSDGFLLTSLADTNSRTLRIYVGLYGAEGKIQASLSDLSAAAFTDTSLKSVYGNDYGVYTLDYEAASAGQTLTVRYTSRNLFDADYGNITLQAATLSGASAPVTAPPVVMVTKPANNANFTPAATIAIEALASDPDGSISRVEFFIGRSKLGETVISPYTFTWTNVGDGDYSLTARAIDNRGVQTTSDPVAVQIIEPTLALLNASVNGDNFTFSLATVTNRAYTIEYTTRLSPTNWQTLQSFVGDGNARSMIDTAHGQQRFYRARRQ